jgi:PPOX class probable F420-dependent enzyme
MNERLLNEKNVWLATVRPNGKPHLVPIWFVWFDEKIYICTQESVKVKNIRANNRVSVALEDGNAPVIAEGIARLLSDDFSEEVARLFQDKYDWEIRTDSDYNILIEVTPTKWVKW